MGRCTEGRGHFKLCKLMKFLRMWWKTTLCMSKESERLTWVGLLVLARPGRLLAVLWLDLQQVGAASLPIKHRLRVDDPQFGIDPEQKVVAAAVSQQGVGDLWSAGMQNSYSLISSNNPLSLPRNVFVDNNVRRSQSCFPGRLSHRSEKNRSKFCSYNIVIVSQTAWGTVPNNIAVTTLWQLWNKSFVTGELVLKLPKGSVSCLTGRFSKEKIITTDDHEPLRSGPGLCHGRTPGGPTFLSGRPPSPRPRRWRRWRTGRCRWRLRREERLGRHW